MEEASSSGTVSLTDAQSALALSMTVTNAETGDVFSYADVAQFSWSAESETGVEPELSVTTIPDGSVFWPDPTAPRLNLHDIDSEVEIALLNPTETGAVELTWWALVEVGGSDAVDLVIAAELRPGPSSSVRLPSLRSFRAEELAVVTVVATVAATPTSEIRVEQGEGSFPSGVVIDGRLLEPQGGVVLIPWPSACSGGCTTSFQLPLAIASEPVLISTDEATGSIGAVTRLPARTTATVRLPDGPYLSDQRRTHTIEVTVPGAPDNPLRGQVLVGTRVADPDHPLNDTGTCSTDVDVSTGSGGFEEDVSFLGKNELVGALYTLEPGSTTSFEVRIGTDTPGRDCDLDADLDIPVEVGVVTYGIDDALPAELRLT